MLRLTRFGAMLLLIILTSGAALANTHYIASNGSDSNDGASKATPWLHAPGMNGCSAQCASYSPAAGDQFIFRGGDTWHRSSGNPVGLSWNWNWDGSSSNCNYSTGAVSTCIYIGVDQAWFSGGSWARPIMTLDNPLTTGRPSSCKFDDSSVTALEMGSHSYLIVDNLEFVGTCWSSSSGYYIHTTGNQIAFKNMYFHGWTYGSNSSSDTNRMIGAGVFSTGRILVTNSICDGSDSSLGNTALNASGFCYDAATDYSYDVFNHVSNGIEGHPSTIHDCIFENMYEPQGPVHGNVVETLPPYVSSTGDIYFYNNLIRNINEGETVELDPAPGFNLYYFNNVVHDVANGQNCLIMQGQGSAGQSNFYVYNNTWDFRPNVQGGNNGGCSAQMYGLVGGAEFNGTLYLQNNHFINYSPAALTTVWFASGNPLSHAVVDNGNEVFQTESAANGQGYTAGNDYAPTGASTATVIAGGNLTNSCSTFSPDSALCSGTSNGVSEQSGNGGVVGSYPAIKIVPRSASKWNAGAYQVNSGTTTNPPSAPSGLTATVQ